MVGGQVDEENQIACLLLLLHERVYSRSNFWLIASIPDSRIQVLLLDLADLDSVVQFGKTFNSLQIPLDILVNNAGVFAMSAPRSVCFGNYELHLLTNYLAGALVTLLLLPALKLAAKSTQKVRLFLLHLDFFPFSC